MPGERLGGRSAFSAAEEALAQEEGGHTGQGGLFLPALKNRLPLSSRVCPCRYPPSYPGPGNARAAPNTRDAIAFPSCSTLRRAHKQPPTHGRPPSRARVCTYV